MTYLRRLLTAAIVTAASFALLVITGTANAQSPTPRGLGAGIAGSPHDFTDSAAVTGASDAWNTSGEICAVCHAPHDANKTVIGGGLLWNRAASPNDGTYTMYSTSAMNFIDGTESAQPDGISKLCLSCHDGAAALEDFSGATGGTTFIVASRQIPADGTTLTGTHPISITYAGDANMNDPATTPMGTSGFISEVLDNGKVQCSTCHDVHDSPGEAVANTNLLRVGNTVATGSASGLCLTCHNK